MGSTETDTTTIVIVFVSFGGVFCIAFLALALCCFIKKMKNKKKKTVEETEVMDVDEHLKVKEAVVEGPYGAKAVVLSVEDDVHIQEEIRKNERCGQGLHAKAGDIESVAYEDREAGLGASSSNSTHHHLEHNA